MKRFIIEHSQGEFYSVHSGLALVGLVSEQVHRARGWTLTLEPFREVTEKGRNSFFCCHR